VSKKQEVEQNLERSRIGNKPRSTNSNTKNGPQKPKFVMRRGGNIGGRWSFGAVSHVWGGGVGEGKGNRRGGASSKTKNKPVPEETRVWQEHIGTKVPQIQGRASLERRYVPNREVLSGGTGLGN